MKQARIISISIALSVAIVAVLYGVDLPGHTMLWREAGNTGHILLFGVMAVTLVFLSRAILGGRVGRPIIHYAISFVLTSGFGFATEFMQWFTPRDADFWDIVRDVIGAFVFLGIVILFDKKNFRDLQKNRPKKTVLIIAVTLVFIAGISPVIAWTGGYVYRAVQAPTICSFDSFIDRLFIRTHSADLRFTDDNSASITFRTGQYPEFYYKEPLPDWTPYRVLSFVVTSPADTSWQLYMRIEDVHHRGAYADRFNRTFTVEPGRNVFEIPLDEVREAPASREMDMTFISAFSLFAKDLKSPLMFYLDDITLQK